MFGISTVIVLCTPSKLITKEFDFNSSGAGSGDNSNSFERNHDTKFALKKFEHSPFITYLLNPRSFL